MIQPVETIRRQFPALKRRYAGGAVAYFDGPGGTQVPERVAEAVRDYLLGSNANTHWGFPTSVETDVLIAGARSAMADLLGGTPDEIVFGPNMTTLTFQLARALGRGFPPGSEVVVTELDHRANVDPWLDMAAMWNFEVRSVPFHVETGTLDMRALETAVNERTRLVAVGGASNALGTINDLAAVRRLTRDRDCLLFVDAVHSTPHLPVDVAKLECDALACSPYKFYGPHLGVLWVRRSLLDSLRVAKLLPASNRSPERMETGTLDHEGIAGTLAAVEFLASLDGETGSRRERLGRTLRELHARGNLLAERLWAGLTAIDGIRVVGPAPGTAPRTPTVSFVLQGLPSAEVSRRLADDHGIYCSHGDFYATDVARCLGVADVGLVRAGAACYTNLEEVDRLIAGVQSISAGTGRSRS